MELFKSSAGIYKKRHQRLLFLLRQKIPFATKVLMPILIGQVPFAVLSVCLSVCPPRAVPRQPRVSNKARVWTQPRVDVWCVEHTEGKALHMFSVTDGRDFTPNMGSPQHPQSHFCSWQAQERLNICRWVYTSHQPRSYNTNRKSDRTSSQHRQNLTQRSTTLSRAPEFF